MKTVKLIFFRGKGIMSALIRWQTRGKFSHVGILFEDGVFFESWTGSAKHLWRNGGVTSQMNYQIPKDAAVATVEVPDDAYAAMQRFALQQRQKRYDYRSVIRFLTRAKPEQDNKFFCSELVVEILAAGQVIALCAAPSVISPAVLWWSPNIRA